MAESILKELFDAFVKDGRRTAQRQAEVLGLQRGPQGPREPGVRQCEHQQPGASAAGVLGGIHVAVSRGSACGTLGARDRGRSL